MTSASSYSKIEWALRQLDKAQWRSFCIAMTFEELQALKTSIATTIAKFANTAMLDERAMVTRMQYVLDLVEAEILSRGRK